MPGDTKDTIAEAARKLVKEKQIKKLTVKDIVEECHITRQTFYYHFEDIPAMFRWVLQRDTERLIQKAIELQDGEQELKFFFQVALQAAPDIQRSMETNYGMELQKILYDYGYQLISSGAEKGQLYANYSDVERNLLIRYHTYALLGLLQNWTPDDTEHIDQIVHKLYLLIGDGFPEDK